MKKTIFFTLLFILVILTMSMESSSIGVQVKEYLEHKFPAIFTIYLSSLQDLDEYEKEFIDLLEKLPATEQRIFTREVYEDGFSIELLEKLRGWRKKVEKPFLKVAYPVQSGQKISGNPIFVFGCTTPFREVTVSVNGVEVEKFDYRTGNFLTLVEVPEGVEFPIKVTAALNGEETSLEKTVIYQPSWQEMPIEPLAIHPLNVQPKQNQVLEEGSQLRVIIQGSPQAEAVFRIGNDLKEIPMDEIDTLSSPFEGKGVYLGSYIVNKEDIPSTGKTDAQVITVTLSRGNEQISRELPGKVIFSSGIPSRKVEVTGNRTRLYRIKEDSFGLPGSTLGGDGWLTQVIGFDLLPGSRFKISGNAGDYFRVKLGVENFLIHQNDVQEIEDKEREHQSLLSQISLKETETEAEIRFSALQHIPFLIEDGPQQLRLMLYGVQQSENIAIEGQAPSIKAIEFTPLLSDQPIDDVVIDIKSYHLLAGFNYYWDDSELVISLRRLPDMVKDNPLKGRIIVLDPGHGGEALGAIGPGDVHEKDIVLEISKYLQKLLEERGARIIMTRSQDTNVNIQKRIDMAVAQQADLFVSIHANAHAEGADAINYHGHMTLYNYNYNQKLAEIILDNLVKRTGLPRARVWQRPDLTVLRQPQVPSVLVETAFLMHPDDNWYLLQSEYQRELALGIMNGITDYFLNLILSY